MTKGSDSSVLSSNFYPFFMNYRYGWHVLYVKSHWEKKVNESLESASLETFLPLIKTVRQWSDRKKTLIKPLFPSYVFVKINSRLELHKAMSVEGACTFLRFGNEYALITEKEIKQIKILLGEDITDIEVNPKLPEIGEIRKIKYGALCGLESEVLKVGNGKKIIVRLHSLKQNIRATIPSSYF